jgi:hypothetical protein
MLVLAVLFVTIFHHSSVPKGFRWILLFLASLIAQMLVVSTGGLYSPFLVLFHFLSLGINLFFPFITSVLFVVFTFLVLAGIIVLDGVVLDMLYADPIVPLLYSISFVSIIPLGYLLAHKYKLTDTIVSLLKNQIEVEEAIIADLSELVFVTDRDMHILAVNEAAEQALHKSKAELLHSSLFNVLYLRDKEGMVVDQDSLKLGTLLTDKTPVAVDNLSLLGISSFSDKKVGMRIKPIINYKGVVEQISIIISVHGELSKNALKNLEEASARHNAMIEGLKRKFLSKRSEEFDMFVLISKAEKDISYAHTIEAHSIEERKGFVDIASLCRETVAAEQDFAQAFRVPIEFVLPNYGKKDIAPLVTSLFAIAPEKFTGPFFTAYCEINYLSIVIQKLLDVGVLLASSEENPSVQLLVERKDDSAFLISVNTRAPVEVLQKQADIFVLYYGSLVGNTNLSLGSGLEGYLAKRITDALEIPLRVVADTAQNCLIFQLEVHKKKK